MQQMNLILGVNYSFVETRIPHFFGSITLKLKAAPRLVW
jgi:hypothetical protein